MYVSLTKEEKTTKILKRWRLWALVNFSFLYNYNYLRLAMIVICNATIRPMDAIIGNNNELS